MRVGLPHELSYVRDQSEGGNLWKDTRFIEGEPHEMIAWASHVLASAIAAYALDAKEKK